MDSSQKYQSVQTKYEKITLLTKYLSYFDFFAQQLVRNFALVGMLIVSFHASKFPRWRFYTNWCPWCLSSQSRGLYIEWITSFFYFGKPFVAIYDKNIVSHSGSGCNGFCLTNYIKISCNKQINQVRISLGLLCAHIPVLMVLQK